MLQKRPARRSALPVCYEGRNTTVTVLRNGSAVGAGEISIESVSPGFFAANADGQGVPAAVVLRVKSDGSQTFEPVAQFNQTTNRFEPVEIDLGPETDQLFLIAYDTGFRYRSALSAVSVTITMQIRIR